MPVMLTRKLFSGKPTASFPTGPCERDCLDGGRSPVTDPGRPRGLCPPCKISLKKMAAKGGLIDFIFPTPTPSRPLGPLLVPVW